MDVMNNGVGDKLLTSADAAAYLGFTQSWMAKLRMNGRGCRYVRLGRKVRYRRSDLDAWANENYAKSTSAERSH